MHTLKILCVKSKTAIQLKLYHFGDLLELHEKCDHLCNSWGYRVGYKVKRPK